jgi:hypothetical protein
MRSFSRICCEKVKMYTMLSDSLRHVGWGGGRGGKYQKNFAIIRAQTQIEGRLSALHSFSFFLGLLPMVSSIFSSKGSIVELSVKSSD